jgi:hypothetical protein
MKVIMIEERGCKIAKCMDADQEQAWMNEDCSMVPGPVREKTEKECSEKGLDVIKSYDENGCQILKCAQPNECQREISKEASEKCKSKGGEFVVKKDDKGCVVYSECVTRGDNSRVYVEKIEKVPDATELLDIAFKLENLKMSLDKLAKQTNEIADYYKSTGSNEEQRFTRVSDMFISAKVKVDNIKTKIRNKLKTLTTDDITEIKTDIKYLKDVTIKDIVYVMLSTGDDVKAITSGSGENDCGSDSVCFDKAFRICKPVSFNAEGNISVKITGLEKSTCIMTASASKNGQNYDMTCKIEKYADGIGGAESNILPYCTGSLKDMMASENANKTKKVV